ncbi:MAG: hypothetical protein IJ719_19280 [Clostridia bacterium]|nr:hypothetical protein [Clostridia bacterium]
MAEKGYAVLRSRGRYTEFQYNDMVITFLHGKDLQKYLSVKEWDNGYLVVECMGRLKGEYEDYIDLTYILENLYMDPEKCLRGVRGVEIENA